jgi:hypothetical protein
MQETNLNSWEEFENQLKKLEEGRLEQKSSSKFLYRGQGRKSYRLETTLERNLQKSLSLKEYHHLIFVVKPQIESFMGTKWNILSYPDGFDNWLINNYGNALPHAFSSIEFLETYSYMIDLRHHGFPSPLIDWSSSPYVAAYFAFKNIHQFDEDVSIYIYLEIATELQLKRRSGSMPHIHRFGPYIKTDRRHFIQQSQYTVCIILDNEGTWRYISHERAFARNNPNQDVLWKFNIPCSERLKVLKLLDSYNINALSLFGSKESLMETMALREIHFRDREL